MNRLIYLAISFSMLLTSNMANGECRTESEIPSSTPTSRFTDHGDGTVSDSVTGLMWAKCAEGLSGSACATGSAQAFTWQGALHSAENSTLANYSNWRLPNVKELESIIERRCFNPSVDPEVFPYTPASFFWSASRAKFYGNAQMVGFNYGRVSMVERFSSALHVRLVRSEQ